MKEREDEPDPQIAAMLEQAWLYGKMADDLRAQAAQARFERDNPQVKLSTPAT